MLKRWSEKRQERRLERKKERFIREVAPLLAEGERMKASVMVYVARDDVQAGRIWPEEELRKAYAEQSDEELKDFIGYEQAGMAMYAAQQRLPQSDWDRDPVLAEMKRRAAIAASVLTGRQGG